MTRAAELKVADQMKTFAREESGAKASMHKDLRALHEVNLAQFREEGVGDSVVQMQSVPGPRIANKTNRKYRALVASKATKHVKNCLLCGRHGCVQSTCAKRSDQQWLAQENIRLLVLTQLTPLEKRRRKLIAHIKYTNISQRSAEYNSRRRASRTCISWSFCDFHQASHMELVLMHIEDGCLQNLSGAPCVNPKCEDGKGYWGTHHVYSRTLGKLRAASKGTHRTITLRSVFYRCLMCRMRYSVNRGSLTFPPEQGGYGVKERTLCYWNHVHGAPLLLTHRQTKLSEDVVRSYYRHCRVIISSDAVRRQRLIVFGGKKDRTTDIEVDEHSFVSWEANGTHLFFVWIGMQ